MGCICREVIFFLILVTLDNSSGSVREQCGQAATFTNCKCEVRVDNKQSKNLSSSTKELTTIENQNGTEVKCLIIQNKQNDTEKYLLQVVEAKKDLFNTCYTEANLLECLCQGHNSQDMSSKVSFLITSPSNCSQQKKTGSPIAERTVISKCDKAPPGDPFVSCHNKYVAEGKSLMCVCEARFTDSRPADFSLTWPRYSHNSSLIVINVTRDDNSKVFTCLMTWCGHNRTTNYTLHVAYGPDSENTKIHGPNSFITDGTLSVNLTCLATEVYPAPRYTWDGVTCQNNDSHTGTCEVKPKPPGDDGRQVECTARSSEGDYKMSSAWHRLSLIYPPPQPPNIYFINGPTLGDGDVIHCIVSGGKPLVKSVNFTCLSDPPHEDQPDTRTALTVFSSLVIDSTKIKENITECVCHAVWEPKEEWYSNSTTVFVFIQTQDKADQSFQAIIFGAAGGGGALFIVLIIIIIVLARSKARRRDTMYDPHSAWYTYEHSKVTDPQGLNRTEDEYFTRNSAGQSSRRWRSYIVSYLPSDAGVSQGPQDKSETFFVESPKALASTTKAVLPGNLASQSCSNLLFALKPPVSHWQSDDNNFSTQETVSPFEEEEYYSELREEGGAMYLNNPSPDDPECLGQDETSHCSVDNSSCFAEDVLPEHGLSISSEFRDNKNNRNGYPLTALSDTKDVSTVSDTRAEVNKIFESREKNFTDHSKTSVIKGSLENILIEQYRRNPTLQPKPDILGRRASRSCSDLQLALQKMKPQLTKIEDNNERRERDMSTDYDNCFCTQTPSESKTSPQDGENNSCYFTLEENEYTTGFVPSKLGQSTGALYSGKQHEINPPKKQQVSASLQPGKDMSISADIFAELVKRFESKGSSATNQSEPTMNKGSKENVLGEQSRKKPALLPKPALRGRKSSRSCSNLHLGIQKLKPTMASVGHNRQPRGRDMSSDYDDCYCPQTPSQSKSNSQNGENNYYYYTLEENEYSPGYVSLKQGQSTGTLYRGKQRGINARMKQEISTHLHPGRGLRDAGTISRSTAKGFSQETLTTDPDGVYDSFIRDCDFRPEEDFSSQYNHI